MVLPELSTRQLMWSRKTSIEILRRGPGHREDGRWAIPLSYHDPATGSTDSELSHWATMTRPQGGHTVSNPIELSWLNHSHGVVNSYEPLASFLAQEQEDLPVVLHAN